MAVAKPDNIPSCPGVYIFRRGRTILYVGKAVNLKRRLASYFRKNCGFKITQMRSEARSVTWHKTPGEIAALIEEARLIKAHIPKYNVLLRDDKNYAYVGVTKERFPRIFITHQPTLLQIAKRKAQNNNEKAKTTEVSKSRSGTILSPNAYRLTSIFIGPFTSSVALRGALKLLRKAIHYCTCRRPHHRQCVNAHIGRCPGYCCDKMASPTEEEIKAYRAGIAHLSRILHGRTQSLVRQLKKMMRDASAGQNFESAAALRDEIEKLENIFQHRMVLDATPAKKEVRRHVERGLMQLFARAEPIRRAEAYDISNISGTAATGSMVVFMDGAPAKSEYRIFNIKTVRQASDVDMMKEVFIRRFAHAEWSYPDLIVIDGGKPQLTAALPVIMRHGFSGVVSALAKREEELYIAGRQLPIRLDTLPAPVMHFFQHIRDEAHRFAKKQHHILRKKLYAQK